MVTKGVRGSAQQYVASLAEGLRARSWDVEVALGVGKELGEWCQQQGILAHRVALDSPINPAKDALAGRQLCQLMRQGHYDVVHISSTKAGIIGLEAARRAGVPAKLFTAHGFRSLLLTARLQRRFWTWMERGYLKPADRVIVVSKYEMQECIRRGILPGDKVVMIQNGVSLERVAAGERAGREYQELGLRGDELVVGTVGRLEGAKGMEWWVRAAAIIATREPRARFVVVGGGPQERRLHPLGAELGLAGRIVWVGQRVGVEYLPLFDVFLLTSLYEALPIAILEAMAARLPVVATAVGGNPEVVADGETGLLAPARDERKLARAVLSLLSDETKRHTMGRRAREKVEREFTEERMVARVAELYETLLAERVGWRGLPC